jgi:ParB/RepB/Spo0J family partition protein
MPNETPSKTSDKQGNTFYIDPTTILVKEGLPRFRKELGKIEDLAESIRVKGQIQPVVINHDMELIAGGRRLAACLLGGLEVLVMYKDAVDPLLMRELEVEENVQRKPFTAAEEVLATDELHRIKQQIHGASQSGVEGGWTLDKTAETIGKTRGSVIEDIKLAEALRNFPELEACKTKSDIKKAVKTIENTMTRAVAASEFDKVVSVSSIPVTIEHAPAEEHMLSIADASVDLLLTDPPYGIDVFSSLDSFVSKTIGKGGFIYNDDADKALVLYQALAVESHRFAKTNAHAFVFCCPEHFPKIQRYFRDAGWLVHIRPMIWIKRTSGQNNAPYHWPSSCYEMIMYARKADSVLVRPGLSDWLQHDPVVDSEKVHQAQKPIQLLRDLISRAVYPNSTIYDPFCGSGSGLIAGLEEKCQVIGCDSLKEAYDAGRSQIINYQKELEQRP